MRLNKNQKEILFQWIAEGIKPGEINKRAAGKAEPFTVTRQQVEYYRRQCTTDIEKITKQGKFQALNTGYALREVRVEKLAKLAELMERDLLGGLLWIKVPKTVAKVAGFVREFNKAEVDAYSRILDDIAKETGGRVHKQEITGAEGSPFGVGVFTLDEIRDKIAKRFERVLDDDDSGNGSEPA